MSTLLAAYNYNALNRRIIEDDGTTATRLFYSADWQVLEEQVSGQTTTQYVWSPVYIDAMILRDRDTDSDGDLDERLYVQQDANWNVTALVDALTGNVVQRFVQDPFGFVTDILDDSWSPQSDAFDWKYLHQGLRLDQAVGMNLYDGRNRIYDPVLQRWLQVDPTGFEAGDSNLYRYVGNGPGNRVDPTGEWFWVAAGGVIGAVVGGVAAAVREEDALGIIKGAVVGGAVGVLVTATAGAAGSAVAIGLGGGTVANIVGGAAGSGAGSAVGSVVSQLAMTGRVDPDQVMTDTLFGVGMGGGVAVAPAVVNVVRNILPPPSGGLVLVGAGGPIVSATTIPAAALPALPAKQAATAAGVINLPNILMMSAPIAPRTVPKEINFGGAGRVVPNEANFGRAGRVVPNEINFGRAGGLAPRTFPTKGMGGRVLSQAEQVEFKCPSGEAQVAPQRAGEAGPGGWQGEQSL